MQILQCMQVSGESSPSLAITVTPFGHAMLQVRYDFDEPDFAMIDTLFSLAEAHLFMQLVELQDKEPHLLPGGKTRPDLYRYASI